MLWVEQGCIDWSGPVNKDGYGLRWTWRRTGGRERNRGHIVYMLAHRWVYERAVGEIPDGLELDHVCNNRRCVNPAHLEPVTHAENVRRGVERRRAA